LVVKQYGGHPKKLMSGDHKTAVTYETADGVLTAIGNALQTLPAWYVKGDLVCVKVR